MVLVFCSLLSNLKNYHRHGAYNDFMVAIKKKKKIKKRENKENKDTTKQYGNALACTNRFSAVSS